MLNETIKTIMSRRSIRKFRPEQIRNEELEAILEAGKYAPSGANQQSALLVVVQDKETIEQLDRLNNSFASRDIDQYYGAPTIIIALADRSKVTPVEDATLALGNIFNAAAALGIGTCWVHRARQMFDSEKGKELLKRWGIEGDYVGVGSCAMGYPDCPHPEAKPRKDNYVVYVR